jgi:hypothetical protein
MRHVHMILLPAALSLVAPAYAADAVVGDGSPGSCTEAAFTAAVATANNGGGLITFNCGPAPHAIVFTGEKLLGDQVVIDGAGLITLSGGLGTRHFRLLDHSEVALRNLTLTLGNASPGGSIWAPASSLELAVQLHLEGVTLEDNISGSWGGAIAGNHLFVALVQSHVRNNQAAAGGGGINLNPGGLVLQSSTMTDNSAGTDGGAVEAWFSNLGLSDSRIERNTAAGAGGGLSLRGAFFTQLTRMVVRSNDAAEAGGLYVWDGSDVTIDESWFDANSSAGLAGGLGINTPSMVTVTSTTFSRNSAVIGGGIENLGTLALQNATISGNSALGGGGLSNSGTAMVVNSTIVGNVTRDPGAGIDNLPAGLLEIHNSLLVANRSNNGLVDSQCNFGAAPLGLSFSIWSDTTCGTGTSSGNQPNTNPGIAALARTCTGLATERTPTHAIEATSPAIDAASCAMAPQIDQRGVPRPQGLGCDVGAVEHQAGDCFPLFADDFDLGNTNSWSSTTP